jgi:hypothetical protein
MTGFGFGIGFGIGFWFFFFELFFSFLSLFSLPGNSLDALYNAIEFQRSVTIFDLTSNHQTAQKLTESKILCTEIEKVCVGV